MTKIIFKSVVLIGAVLAGVLLYLLVWPTPVMPLAWQPAPALDGPFAANDRMKAVQRLAVGLGQGPEGLAVDDRGRVYAGYEDGRVVELAADGATYRLRAKTQGRPLGIAAAADGQLIVADARRGLLEIGDTAEPHLLTDHSGPAQQSEPINFPDDADIGRTTQAGSFPPDSVVDRKIYFTDASRRFGYSDHVLDILEHGPNGRLLCYDTETHETRVLLEGLYFANGVAVGPNNAYVLVNETGAYRITRYWLKGEKAGTHDVFFENLPGLPDNLSFNGRDRFWVALYAPRDKLVDGLSQWPAVRKMVARLPHWMLTQQEHRSFVVGLDLEGKVVANLQYGGRDAYAPITSVEEQGPWLYFGSLTANSIARLPLQAVRADAPAPPAGWEQAPAMPKLVQ